MTLILATTACGDDLPATTDTASTTDTSTTGTTSTTTTGELPTTGDSTTTTSSSTTTSTTTTTTGPEPTTAVEPTSTTTTTTGDTTDTTAPVECLTVRDCAVAVPDCRTALDCQGGVCVFEDMPQGTPVLEQVAGDCKQVQCDGLGDLQIANDDADIEDDGVQCTLDACEDGASVHIPGMLSCYTGPPDTAGVGVCLSGQQMCDLMGDPVGPCIGEVLPSVEKCELTLLDEDCDGQVNEEGAACVCAPNQVSACYSGPAGTQGVGPCKAGTQTCAADGIGLGPCIGEVVPVGEDCDLGGIDEDCDGQVNESGPSCTCGDGFVSAGEACDDGNTQDGDACSADCSEQIVPLHVYVGELHSCALFTGGRVKCWGSNSNGQLGLGDTESRGDSPGEMGAALPFVDLGPGLAATDLAVGSAQTCALLVGGAIKCWGHGGVGGLGLGDTTSRGDQPGEMGAALPFVDIGTTNVIDLSSGGLFTCALLGDGQIKCWGLNINGELGLGDTNHRGDAPNEMGANLPHVDLGAGAAVTAVDAGRADSCTILANGALKCWGANSMGWLGLGDKETRGDEPGEMGDLLPVLDVVQPVTSVTRGYAATGVVLADATARCWGFNKYGQLGLGDDVGRGDNPGEMGAALPPVALGGSVLQISAGAYHFCARTALGTQCWGYNLEGQLGLGDTEHRGDQPGEMGPNLSFVDLGTGRTAVELSSRWLHTCARLDDDTVKCWGRNDAGQLGLGDTNNRGDQPGEMGDALPIVQLL